ncbi:MAG: hypothetical protein AB8B92_09720 [Gammaproteobacteria bacterium]
MTEKIFIFVFGIAPIVIGLMMCGGALYWMDQLNLLAEALLIRSIENVEANKNGSVFVLTGGVLLVIFGTLFIWDEYRPRKK